MWQTIDEEASGFSGCVESKEVMIFHTPNSFLVDAELCRDSSCGVEHVYPIDVVFSVHKKDAAEGEVTVQKRHLSELGCRDAADAVSGHTREHCWTAMQKLMSEKYGTYLDPELLDVLKKKVATSPDATRADILRRVFAHLMFDRTYFQTAKANRYEARTDVSARYPLLSPLGLADVARKQWNADFEVLVAHATVTSFARKLKAAFVGMAPSRPEKDSTDGPKPQHPLRKANQELSAANKKLANEKSSAEAKLQRTKATLSALTSKIETKVEAPQGPGDLLQRLSTAVTAALQDSATGLENTTQDDAIHPEVALLLDQLKKLDQANGRLQGELADLRNQLVAARQEKKAA